MDFIVSCVTFIFHFDKHLASIVHQFGAWTYGIVFLVIFCETGLVVTPFLPGDSLLFVLGAFSAAGTFKFPLLLILLTIAAVAGDSFNYAIGKYFGHALLRARHIPFFKKEYLDKTHRFFEKYGAKTIVIARFVPIVRTFAPFVAGLGDMSYGKFLAYNVAGGVLWVGLFVSGGYFFGNMPAVKKNFSAVIFIIIILSVLPAAIEVLRARAAHKKRMIYG